MKGMKIIFFCLMTGMVVFSCNETSEQTGSYAGGQWLQDAYIKASNSNCNHYFGYSVAVNGDVIVVGAYHEDSSQRTITNTDNTASPDNAAGDSGAAYVFKKTGDDWIQDAYLKASNAETGDYFGFSVSAGEQFIVVGAYHEGSEQQFVTNTENSAATDNAAPGSGAAYVFKKVNDNWIQDAYIKTSNSDADDSFGRSVAISEDTIVVSAEGEDGGQRSITNTDGAACMDNMCGNCGAVYVFKNDGGDWIQDAYLKASNADVGDSFGCAVAIENYCIAVGACQESGGGRSVVNSDGTATHDNSIQHSGAAYVFRKVNDNWIQDAYLKASNADENDNFGDSVAVYGDTVVVGARYEDSAQTYISNQNSQAGIDNTSIHSGAAYVFIKRHDSWVQEAYLKASNADAYDYYGHSVAVYGDILIVGAYDEDSSAAGINCHDGSASDNNDSGQSGAVYVFYTF